MFWQGCQIGSFGAKNQKFGSFRGAWLQNFYLAVWLLFRSFATFSFHRFFLAKSCEWHVQLVSATVKREAGHYTVAQCTNEHPAIPKEG